MKRIGNQSPTQSVFLPYEKTDGLKAIELYEKSKRKAYPWQKNIVKVILAKDEEGLWAHMDFGFSVPRQNGKNEVVLIRELYGLISGEKILHTAHRVQTSSSSWERLCAVIADVGFVEGEDYKKLAQKGLERIQFLDSGGDISFRTRTTTGGLGESFDLLVIDEAQEYTPDQKAALQYTISASTNPQTLMCGTPPTPLSSGTVFVDYRKEVLDGKSENAGWAEWSVEKESDPENKDLWYLTNPSLGYRITERTVKSQIRSDKIDFNVQRLGYWISYNQKSAISEKDWEAVKVKNLPTLRGKLFVGIKYGRNGANVAMSIAVRTLLGKVFVESIDCQNTRSGNAWLLRFLELADVEKVVVDGAGAQEILKKEMIESGLDPPILPTVKEIIIANSKWEQGVYQKRVCHLGQPSLSQIVTNCGKRNIGSNGGFGYKALFDDMEIALMDSAILAYWICSETEVKPQKQQIRY